MLASPVHKCQSVITQKSNHHLKQKKRRKNRKKTQIFSNLETDCLSSRTFTNKVLKHKALNKTKQYYQHDNRLGMKIKSIRIPHTSSEIFATFNENAIDREIHYNEVAKKFKPLPNNKNSINLKKAFSKNLSEKNLKTVQKQKLKQKFAFVGEKRECENKSTTNPTTTLALMQPQICLCTCQNEEQKYSVNSRNKNNNFGLQTAVFANVNNKLSSCISNASNATTASLVKCSKKLATINNDFTKILEHLQNHAPTLIFDNIFDSTKLFKNVENPSRIHHSYHSTKALQGKNPNLRKSLNISECFVEDSNLDLEPKAKEEIAKSLEFQKDLDTKREEAAAVAAKETSKHYTLVRTPSMEHDLSGNTDAVGADKTYSPLKKKKKKKIRSPSQERKRDKKKKSKKSKKESKSKKSKKERKRKCSESETNADNAKESVDEGSESDDVETEAKKCRKKSKKKKRRNKRKELSSSSDEARSMSPLDKPVRNKKGESFNESAYYSYRSRSRSKEKSIKVRELQRHRNESAYNRSRRSKSQNNRRKSRSYSRCNKNTSGRQNETKEVQNLKYLNRSRDHRSHDRNASEYRRSRSILKSKDETAVENVKNLKRKRVDKYSQGKGQSPSTDKRKRYSQPQLSVITRKSCEKITLEITTAIEGDSYKQRSRTPNQKRWDVQDKLHKSRSMSPSTIIGFRNKSLSPPNQTSKIIESTKYEKKIKNPKKCYITSRNDSDNNTCKKTNSRSISLSSHTSSAGTRISKSRTPSPKKQYKDDPSASKSLRTQKLKEQKTNSPNSIRSLTPQKGSSRSTIDEKSRKDKKRSSSSKEWLKYPSDRIEQKSRTPPPKLDKKPLSPRSSRNSSELSYSPARRNPERYRDILENSKNEKSKIDENTEDRKEIECDRKEKAGKNERNLTKPVVRLQSDDESDCTERNTEKILDEFQELKHDRELNDLKMLEHLKTGLAAKAKEKIKTIEKMAASTSTPFSTNNEGEVNDKCFKRTVRNSLNDFLTANKVVPAVVATCSSTTYSGMPNSPPGAIYPQTFEEIKKEQESVMQLTENFAPIENKKHAEKSNEPQVDCRKSLLTANDNALNLSPTASPLRNNLNATNKEKDRKRERDLNERERENYNFYKDRYLERRQKSIPSFYSTGGGGIGGGTIGSGNISGSRRNSNNTMLNINHRQRINMCNSGGAVPHHHHHHLHPHHHHPNHKIINSHHNSANSSFFLSNNSSANPHTLLCNHSNNSTNVSFNRPSRINNTPLITATQFNNQMLSKQSNSILVNRRDHRTALSLGLSGTPCTNFSNSNLLLTKANANSHHLHAAPLGHIVGSGHHHHHHGQNTSVSNGGSNPSQMTDRILMAASLVAAQRHSLGVHSAVSSAAAVAAANNLNFLHQQNRPKLVIKPFKINDSQPLVAALADSSLVDAIVSKVSTATVAAAESAARRSRSRSRRSRSRKRHDEKSNGASNSGGAERDGNRRRSLSRSRSSSSTSSRSRGHSHRSRSSQSRTSQSSSSSHTSSRSSSSSSFGTSRSGTRSPSIPRRRGSPSFLDRRRITSARKRPIPYHRKLSSDVSSCYCSSCCSRESSPHSRSPSQDSRSPLKFLET